jgi:sphingosine kinase
MTSTIKSGQVIYSNKPILLTLNDSELIISSLNRISNHWQQRNVSLLEIFAVRHLTPTHPNAKLKRNQKSVLPFTFAVYLLQLSTEQLQRLTFTANSQEEADDWVSILQCTVFRIPMEQNHSLSQASPNDSHSKVFAGERGKRKVLLILNPNSGTKKGRHLFQKIIKPIWDLSHMEYRVIETQYSKHAMELCSDPSKVDLSEYREIVAMGGDGSLYEVINGCMLQLTRRRDGLKPSDIKFGVIPSGTSNGLASSIGCCKKNGSHPSIALAALIVARGFYEPLDLITVFQNDRRHFLFLSVSWGIIADADLGTENLRWMGSTRNLVGAVRAILKQKYLNGRLQYIENKEATAHMHSNQNKEVKKSNSFMTIGQSSSNAKNEVEAVPEKAFPFCDQLFTFFSETFKQIAPSFYQEHLAFKNQIEQKEKLSVHESEQGSSNMQISGDISNPDSIQIKTIEDKFFLFLIGNVTHIAHDCMVTPNARLSDGAADLIMLRDTSLSRFTLVKLFMGAEDGTVVQHPSIEYKKIKSFVLTPLEEGSFIAIDGEMGAYETIIGEVHRGFVNIMTR